MSMFQPFHGSGFVDQADGLRRLFAASRQRVVPVLSNPHAPSTGLVLERPTAAFAACGANTLVVDASEAAPEPSELASIDLASCIEMMSVQTAYLAARGLPLRHVNARGSTEGFLDALADGAPHYEVVLLHASASDLARLCGRRGVRPILLAEHTPESVTHAYAGLKLLAQRCDFAVFDLLVAGRERTRMAPRIAERISSCADRFIGALVHEVAVVDPSRPADGRPTADLLKLAAGQLSIDEPPADMASRSRPATQGSSAAQSW